MLSRIYTMKELVEMDANPKFAKTKSKPFFDLCKKLKLLAYRRSGKGRPSRTKVDIIYDILQAQGTPQPLHIIEAAYSAWQPSHKHNHSSAGKKSIKNYEQRNTTRPVPWDHSLAKVVRHAGIDNVRKGTDGMLQAQCYYNGCRQWFTPVYRDVDSRRQAILEQATACDGAHLYCSDTCKAQCKAYGRSAQQIIAYDELVARYTKFVAGLKNRMRERPTLEEFKMFGMPTAGQLIAWRKQVIKINQENYALGAQWVRCAGCEQVWWTHEVECHHVVPKVKNPAISLDPANGVCLCKDCHKNTHKRGGDCPMSELSGGMTCHTYHGG